MVEAGFYSEVVECLPVDPVTWARFRLGQVKYFHFSTIYFQSLLTDEQVANAPVLILGNKIDKPGAASEDEIRHHFGLHGQTTGKVRG